jgi:hypothetical protein
VKPRELREMYGRAIELGCTVELTGKNHIKVTTPKGEAIFGALTASDQRAVKNARSLLRRYGIEV